MPTILTHATIPLALGIGLGSKTISRRLLAAGVIASMLPDMDVLAFRFHIAYADQFGHRGASHSLLFAAIAGLVAMLLAHWLNTTRGKAFLFVFVSCASHGLLDTLTNGGLGVALAWPFSDQRFFAPWHGIEVSPIDLHRVFSGRGLEVLQSEFAWVWFPALAVCAMLYFMRRFYSSKPTEK